MSERGRTNAKTQETERTTERSRSRSRDTPVVTGKRVPIPANPYLDEKGVNTMLEKYGPLPATKRTEETRAEHDDKWRAIQMQAKLTAGELSDVTSIVETCNYEEIAGLSKLLGEMRTDDESSMEMDGAQGFGGGGKMVGGNPILHFAHLQKWLIDHSGVAGGINYMSACAKWFIDKILAGLSTIGRGLSRASSGCMNLARRAMTEGTAAGNKAFTLLLGFAEAFQTMSSSAGTTVKTKFSHWVGTAGTAASGWSADASAAANPYLQELKGYLNTNLDALQTKILARLPNPPSAPEFRQWLDTLSMNDVLLATANAVAVISILPEVASVTSRVVDLLAMAFSNGIVGAAWIADNKMLTGSFIVYQGLVMSPKIISACMKADEYLANTIGTTTQQDFLVQIQHLKRKPIAKALAQQVIRNKITTNKIARDEAEDRLTRAKQDKALQDHAQELENEAAALNAAAARLQDDAAEGHQDDAAGGHQEHAMETEEPVEAAVVAEVVAAVVEGAGGGGAGGGAAMDQSGSESDLGGGGKRATRKRGKRSSKRAPRKTKTTRKKTTRKKRRGKK